MSSSVGPDPKYQDGNLVIRMDDKTGLLSLESVRSHIAISPERWPEIQQAVEELLYARELRLERARR